MEYATNDDDDEELSPRLKFMPIVIIFNSRAEAKKEREGGEGEGDPPLRSHLVPLLLRRSRRWQL
jgi:hypothetical protein